MIAGVFESVGTVMGYFEDTTKGFKSKIRKKTNLGVILKKREMFDDFLFTEKKKPQYRKMRTFMKPECIEILKSTSRLEDSRFS